MSVVEHTIEHMADGAVRRRRAQRRAGRPVALGAVQAADREIARQTAVPGPRGRGLRRHAARVSRPAAGGTGGDERGAAGRAAGGALGRERVGRPGARARPRDHQPGRGDRCSSGRSRWCTACRAPSRRWSPVPLHVGPPVPDARAGRPDRRRREADRDRSEAARLDDGTRDDAGAAGRQGAAAGAAGRRPGQRAPAHRGAAAARGLRAGPITRTAWRRRWRADRAGGGRADRRARPVRRCPRRARRRAAPGARRWPTACSTWCCDPARTAWRRSRRS